MTSPFHDTIAENIERVGWHCISVFPTTAEEAEEMGDGFTYTIGLSEVGCPEILVLGLRPQVCHHLICGLLEKCAGTFKWTPGRGPASLSLPTDEPIEGIANYPMMLIEVNAERACEEFCIQAREYYEECPPILQIFWTDPAGRFPWDEGCVPRHREIQSKIWRRA